MPDRKSGEVPTCADYKLWCNEPWKIVKKGSQILPVRRACAEAFSLIAENTPEAVEGQICFYGIVRALQTQERAEVLTEILPPNLLQTLGLEVQNA